MPGGIILVRLSFSNPLVNEGILAAERTYSRLSHTHSQFRVSYSEATVNNFLVSLSHLLSFLTLKNMWDFPGDPVVKNLSANAGDTGSTLGPGRSHMPQGH